MSAKYVKQRNSQQKIKYNETCTTPQDRDVNSCCNSLSKQSRPQLKMTEHQTMMQHDLKYEQNLKSNQSGQEKSKMHRRQHSHCHKQNPVQDKRFQIFYPQRTLKIQNLIPQPFLSPKNKAVNSSQEIQTRFQQIENIMGVQNDNLREQKEYLLKTIQKMQLKQKEYKNELKLQKNKIFMLQSENRALFDKYEKAKYLISNEIEHEMKEQIESNQTQSTNQKSNQSSMNTTVQMQELNQRFQILMYEYQKAKKPEIRKKCVQIAKQLKKLKKLRALRTQSQQKGINKPPTVPKSPKISKKLYQY